MAVKYCDDAASCELARRLSDALIRSKRTVSDGGDVGSCDVNAFTAALEAQSRGVSDRPTSPALRYAACEALYHFGFDTVIDREGTLLVIDANAEPYVTRYRSTEGFLAAVNEPYAHAKAARVRTATMTGGGSSALGAAAFAWTVSQVLQQAVVAVVPGNGLPARDADVLNEMLSEAYNVERLVGHGSGALTIQKATRSLPKARRESLSVAVLRCPADHGLGSSLLGMFSEVAQLFVGGNSPSGWTGRAHAHDDRDTYSRSSPATAFASLRYTPKPRRAT